MGFISFLVLLVIAYLLWRVTDQLPDLIFRLSEVQRDVAELRRALSEPLAEQGGEKAADTPATPASTTQATEPASESSGGDA